MRFEFFLKRIIEEIIENTGYHDEELLFPALCRLPTVHCPLPSAPPPFVPSVHLAVEYLASVYEAIRAG